MNYTSALLSMRRIISNHIDTLTSRSGRNLEEYTHLIDEVLTPIAYTTNPVVNRRLKIIAVQEAASIHNLNAHECTHIIETVLQPRLDEIDKLLDLATPITWTAAESPAATGQHYPEFKARHWIPASSRQELGKSSPL